MRAADESRARYTYVTVAEVARVLACSPASVRRMLAEGRFTFADLPHPLKIGTGDWRIPPEAWARFRGVEPDKVAA